MPPTVLSPERRGREEETSNQSGTKDSLDGHFKMFSFPAQASVSAGSRILGECRKVKF